MKRGVRSVCNICERKFESKNDLITHLRLIHKIKIDIYDTGLYDKWG